MFNESALVAAAAALQRYLAPRARAEGIRWSALGVLTDLQTHGPLAQGELASRQGVRPATMSLLVRELRAGRLVDETPDPDDARRRRLEITPSGRQRLAEDLARLAAPLSAVVAELALAEREALSGALPALLRVLEG